MTEKEIVQALRCTSTPGGPQEDCTGCTYYRKEQLDAELKEKLGVDTWPSCDVNKVGMDAADIIERLTAENADLRKELEWKDMVIALAQRKQAEAEAERDALREKQRWIPVTERLPKPEIDVLIVCNRNGYRFVAPAIYEDGKMLTQDSVWNWNEIYTYGLYSEEADDYYIPEGWWENRQFNPDDVYNNPVDCAVTHWMPLPSAPKFADILRGAPEAPEGGGKADA